MKAPETFSFDWILKSSKDCKKECLEFYTKGGYDIVLVKKTATDALGTFTCYEAGNPLFGGIKTFKNYSTAEKYFFNVVGRLAYRGDDGQEVME